MSCCSSFPRSQLHKPGSSSSSPLYIRKQQLACRHIYGIRPPSAFFQSPALHCKQAAGARRRQRQRHFASAQVEIETKNTDSKSSSDGLINNDDDAGLNKETGVVVIGAGLAGLAAARKLAMAGEPFLLLEASDGVGGRVRTDYVDGFMLDRGFQIFITAYPEAQKVLDYDALELQQFYAGALVWHGGALHRVADPLRHLADGLLSLLNPIGNVYDKILVGLVRLRAAARADDAILTDEESTILQRLRKLGFSEAMVDRFFRPFFGGIFFDRELQTTSRLFEFVFKCLATGSNTLPAAGIGAIPTQIAEALPQNAVRLNNKVTEIVFNEKTGLPEAVKLNGGNTVKCRNGVILAVEQPEARKLLQNSTQKLVDSSRIGNKLSETKKPRSTVCLYFETEKDAIPVKEPVLLLNGSGTGIVNNMFFPTEVCQRYGPAGKCLVSVSLLGLHEGRSDEELVEIVKAELASWFGQSVVDRWRHLRTYRVKFAQPDQTPPTDLRQEARLIPGVYVCGDHRHSSTFDGALLSGRFAAEALLNDLAQVGSQ